MMWLCLLPNNLTNSYLIKFLEFFQTDRWKLSMVSICIIIMHKVINSLYFYSYLCILLYELSICSVIDCSLTDFQISSLFNTEISTLTLYEWQLDFQSAFLKKVLRTSVNECIVIHLISFKIHVVILLYNSWIKKFTSKRTFYCHIPFYFKGDK